MRLHTDWSESSDGLRLGNLREVGRNKNELVDSVRSIKLLTARRWGKRWTPQFETAVNTP
jgi:hypothetical protein